MVQSRRCSLKSIKKDQASHAGLWLDKYLPYQITKGEKVREEQTPYAILVSEVAKVEIPEDYEAFYQRWKKDLQDYQMVFHSGSEVHTFGAVCRKATVQGRMAVGLGDEGVLETSVTLHRTYGVPYIPGSALKGLAASYVRQRMADPQWGSWEDENQRKKKWVPGAAYQIMFGDTGNAGYLTFFDALYVPDTACNNQPLQPDVMTVHHPDYYGDKESPPADWDSPVPVPFLSAVGTYLIAIAGPEPFVNMAFRVLVHALAEVGVGAKTSSGYGRMVLEEGQDSADKQTMAEQATIMKESEPVDFHQKAVDTVRPWLGNRIQMRLDREVANKGYVVRPKPGIKLDILGFIPLE
ncbi:MAG: hypothetical protein GFH27_549287n368 [Chloroflexi bacterium AL-W]|nr:hypothetical protein [Chloroflexi bacterium AL-N1]NOK66642.1 hypothetical protein [Chloroflexi bacterium AL-N10]NOK72030.1 hypothetical protein [Chloroflexi bacterium AL-N5]NOK81287.1 hypothetical protein [Chloroflexi bacterium AL-W]NOK89560.1 hypothetical protein [Chloroflexi bacterium AL-N15]